MKNKKQNPLTSLPNERGIPEINFSQRHFLKKRLFYLFICIALAIMLTFLYQKYQKSKQTNKPEPYKSLSITTAVPAKVFKLTIHQKQPDMHVDTPTKNPLITMPLITTENFSTTNKIDKNSAPLMASPPIDNQKISSSPPSIEQGTQLLANSLGALLHTTITPPQSASIIKNSNYLLSKGSFIDCVLRNKLDSTVPGMISCVVTHNIYSDSGKVILIERGSVVSGEYQSNLQQGQSRIFVVWNRIRTPHGVLINLDSPGTDALGSSGIEGTVNQHFMQRFSGAILLSFFQDLSAAATRSIDNSNTTVTFNNTSDTSQALAVEVLRNTINIPPTLTLNQGARIGIYVARDLDFGSVYDLRFMR